MRGIPNSARPRFLLVGTALAVGFWFMETAVHTFVFREGRFREELFPHDANELWMRILVSALFFLFGLYAHHTNARIRTLEVERAAADLRLQDALAKVLSGFIPICSYCKKIRNDKGYWDQLEAYITEHTGAMFSHGICPACAREHFPQFKNEGHRGESG